MTLELVRLENGVFYGSGGHDCHPAFVRVALRNRWATPYGLDIREFVQAEHAEFAPVARFLRAAERKPRVRCDKSIDKDSARLALARKCMGRLKLAAPACRAPAKGAVLGPAQGLTGIRHTHDCRSGSDCFLPDRKTDG